ncbi:hypothetical protein [Streptomyces melanogenes]|uniref:hypothetical protein n=1 Tax=Streptomyces melanogenes TaxID=67326 RepID=UPI0037A78A18
MRWAVERGARAVISVLDAVIWALPKLSTTGDLGRALELAQLGAQVVRRGHDQAVELVDRGGGGEDRAVAGGEQAAQGLAFTSAPGLDEVLGGQCLLGGPDGVECVGFAATADGRPLGPQHLDDLSTHAGCAAADRAPPQNDPRPPQLGQAESGSPRRPVPWHIRHAVERFAAVRRRIARTATMTRTVTATMITKRMLSMPVPVPLCVCTPIPL